MMDVGLGWVGLGRVIGRILWGGMGDQFPCLGGGGGSVKNPQNYLGGLCSF